MNNNLINKKESRSLTDKEVELVSKIAKRMSYSWRKSQETSEPEIFSHLYVYCISDTIKQNDDPVGIWRYVLQYRNTSDPKEGYNKLYSTLSREAAKYCMEQAGILKNRWNNEKIKMNTNYYSEDTVKKLLPYMFEIPEDIELQGELFTMLMDVRSAFYGLKKKTHKQILLLKYVHKYSFEKISKELNLSEQDVTKSHKQAIEYLMSNLDGEPLVWTQDSLRKESYHIE